MAFTPLEERYNTYRSAADLQHPRLFPLFVPEMTIQALFHHLGFPGIPTKLALAPQGNFGSQILPVGLLIGLRFLPPSFRNHNDHLSFTRQMSAHRLIP